METVQAALWVVVLLVVLALLFDFMNGFHDAANSIATVVSTGVLKPAQAVLFAAFFNVVAIFVFHLSVAATVGKGIVQPDVVDTHVVFGALVVGLSVLLSLGFGELLKHRIQRDAGNSLQVVAENAGKLLALGLMQRSLEAEVMASDAAAASRATSSADGGATLTTTSAASGT